MTDIPLQAHFIRCYNVVELWRHQHVVSYLLWVIAIDVYMIMASSKQYIVGSGIYVCLLHALIKDSLTLIDDLNISNQGLQHIIHGPR